MLARAPPRSCSGAGAGDVVVRCRREAAPSRTPWAVPGGPRRAGAKLVAAAAAGERRTAAGQEPVAAAAPADGTRLANGSAVAGTLVQRFDRFKNK